MPYKVVLYGGIFGEEENVRLHAKIFDVYTFQTTIRLVYPPAIKEKNLKSYKKAFDAVQTLF